MIQRQIQYRVNGETKVKPFDTYANLKKELKKYIGMSETNSVQVYRSRRGEFGEWYERWIMVDNKPKMIDSGWS
jgi:hypothetical protein